MKDRLLGIALIVLGIISVPVCGNDATAALFVIPVGILTLLVPINGGDDNEEKDKCVRQMRKD